MIPTKLSLKNFLCYGDGAPTLDLEGIRVACLCGQNGHGKSALLDAITWALWGKARGKAQDELIHYGQEEMLVDLEFLARDARYRVTRRHTQGSSRRRQGASDLQFQISSGNGYHPITGNSMRETQARIDQTIGMDYDTFTNSAFLLQGRADEFTNRTPEKRKEVLAKIMGLDLYDRLQERFRERVESAKVASSIAEADLERMRYEISRRDTYDSELAIVSAELSQVSEQHEASGQTVDTLKLAVDNLRRRQGELEEIRARIPVIKEDVAHLQKEIESRGSQIETYQILIGEKDHIEAGLAQYREMRERYEQLNLFRERFDALTVRKSQLEQLIGGAKTRLEEQVKHIENRIRTELRSKADAAPQISMKLDESRTRLQELAREEEQITGRRNELQDLTARVAEFQANAQRFKKDGQELRSKLNIVKNSDQGASCPLCGTELGEDQCQRLYETYEDQIAEKLRFYQENQSTLDVAEKEKDKLENELPQREDGLRRNRGESEKAIARLDSQLEEAQKATVELEQEDRQLLQLSQQFENGNFSSEERRQLEGLEAQIVDLGYDQGAHRGLYDEMQKLQHVEERHRRLEEAVFRLPQEQSSLVGAQDMSKRRQTELVELEQKQREIREEVTELPQWEGKLQTAEASYQQLNGRRDELFRRQVGLEGELKRLDQLEEELDKKESELKSSRERQGLYQELADAFGRRGVQAMLIETVLPRLEEEANTLLGRMTDNRMHLKLETQRERKSGKGEPIETLEIKISDEMGPRGYELFSGGEAFRINLALRIALSKVLAHRKGAPLPTLFIDEGFGTQDAAGRERILDVISAIEEDFDKIIVITHLDELKDAFQTRIEVQKEEAGSTFWISY